MPEIALPMSSIDGPDATRAARVRSGNAAQVQRAMAIGVAAGGGVWAATEPAESVSIAAIEASGRGMGIPGLTPERSVRPPPRSSWPGRAHCKRGSTFTRFLGQVRRHEPGGAA